MAMVDHEPRRLWLIDAGYLFNAQHSVYEDYHFDYRKLREKVEETLGPVWRAYYLNSTRTPPTGEQSMFHAWLQSARPRGPKIITKLYALKQVRADFAYCEQCGRKVKLRCPAGNGHHISNKQQKGVDVGIATLALTHRDKYDVLLLSSGDGDLLDMIEFLSEDGKPIELAVFRSGVSTDLQSRADSIMWIDEFREDVKREEGEDAQPYDSVDAE